MTEEERAGWLARALDHLTRGWAPTKPPREPARAELESLLRVARARRLLGEHGAQAAMRRATTVWRRILARLQPHQSPA